MTQNEVIASHGTPDDINFSGGEYGTLEQWIYRYGYNETKYLYLKGGSLKSWQY